MRLTTIACVLSASLASAGDFETAVEEAIDRGVVYLRSQIERSPWWDRYPAGGDAGRAAARGKKKAKAAGENRNAYAMGRTAIELYALLKSDVSFNDPLILQGLAYLGKLDPRAVYCTSLYIMALDAAWEQLETDAILRGGKAARPSAGDAKGLSDRLEEIVRWLLAARHEGKGSWTYGARGGDRYDNSNTQFAVLALGVAARRGAAIDAAVWKEIADHFIKDQEAKGPRSDLAMGPQLGPGADAGRTIVTDRPSQIRARGWPYIGDREPTLNMTAAGLSSLLIANEYLAASGNFPAALRRELAQAIWDGFAHLAATKLTYVQRNLYYGLYSVEKAGDLGGVATIGDLDWYKHGANLLLRVQKKDGSWGNEKQDNDENCRYQTAFALLFLNRATDLLVHARPLIQTGKGSDGEPRAGWLYVSKLGGEVSLWRLVRKLRYRPTTDLLPLLDTVIDEAAKRGRSADLVPPLLLLAGAPLRKVAALALKGLHEATGEKHDDPAQYRAWFAAWSRVTAIGVANDAGGIEELRRLLAATKSLPLKHRIVWALERTRARQGIGDLIGELESADAAYRRRAYGALKFLSGQDIPYDPDGSLKARKDGIERWRAWHRTAGAGGT
jgi:hypothetical protein